MGASSVGIALEARSSPRLSGNPSSKHQLGGKNNVGFLCRHFGARESSSPRREGKGRQGGLGIASHNGVTLTLASLGAARHPLPDPRTGSGAALGGCLLVSASVARAAPPSASSALLAGGEDDGGGGAAELVGASRAALGASQRAAAGLGAGAARGLAGAAPAAGGRPHPPPRGSSPAPPPGRRLGSRAAHVGREGVGRAGLPWQVVWAGGKETTRKPRGRGGIQGRAAKPSGMSGKGAWEEVAEGALSGRPFSSLLRCGAWSFSCRRLCPLRGGSLG